MKKLELKGFTNSQKLRRSEMKTIMAGKRMTPECGEPCEADSFCTGNSSCPCCNSGKCG